MSKEVKDHIGYYVSLCFILVLSGILTLHFSSDRGLQMLTVVVTAIFYVLIGIVHHKENHDLTAKIVVEYVLIASLGMVMVSFLLKGGM